MSRQMIRITTLGKLLETFEKAAESMLQSGIAVYKTPEEIAAFKEGFKTALDMIRKEFDIQ